MAFVIDDSTSTDVTHALSRGLVPRNFSTHPIGCYKEIPDIRGLNFPLIPRSEWSARCAERKQLKQRVRDVRRIADNGKPIASLDQDGFGYCWTHSGTMGTMLRRALMGQPYKRLSAFAVACIIKNYRDQGGWGAQGAEFIQQRGVPDEDHWPMQSTNRNNDNPETWANAAKYKITGLWADLTAPVYDRNLTVDQVATVLLTGGLVIGDFNWWGHSVILTDWLENEPGSFGPGGLNSWSDAWGDLGEFDLKGDRGVPDGAVAILNVLAA